MTPRFNLLCIDYLTLSLRIYNYWEHPRGGSAEFRALQDERTNRLVQLVVEAGGVKAALLALQEAYDRMMEQESPEEECERDEEYFFGPS